ncbi:hypothetical protein ASPBRDRAFT_39380 [Aspergillus brasiliensis CBS 101740]|uniref:Uncharacterized protein n=1 Tax=Aspergillus brasiliensis (strain CBS 101740 / IMI 381727 / IBT 21946) TaxID=767769 RepID=A0A1L9URL3_ASPBC|nr:hypothetical protein ASPBRDRAFT_39380 [Aspergillus brasiliensis CBS 101740]
MTMLGPVPTPGLWVHYLIVATSKLLPAPHGFTTIIIIDSRVSTYSRILLLH